MTTREEHEARVLEGLEKSSQTMAALAARVEALVSALKPPEVIFSGTVRLDANGQWSKSWRYPVATVAVGAAANPLTVAFGAAGASAPTFGPGVHLIGAGRGRVMVAGGNSLTIYGTAGDIVEVQIFTRVQPPSFGQT